MDMVSSGHKCRQRQPSRTYATGFVTTMVETAASAAASTSTANVVILADTILLREQRSVKKESLWWCGGNAEQGKGAAPRWCECVSCDQRRTVSTTKERLRSGV